MCEKNPRGFSFKQTSGFHHLNFIWDQEILKSTLVAYHGPKRNSKQKVRLVHCFPDLELSWASSPAPAMLCLARLIIWLETNKTNCCSKDFFGQPCDSCSYFVRWDRRLGLLLKERNWLSFKSEVSVAWRGALAPGSEKFLEVPIARIVQFLPRIQTHKKYHHWTFQTFTQINASCQF